MSNYTPGPWEVAAISTFDYWENIVARDKVVAAAAHEDPSEMTDEERANANLIAAAPDLLEAAQQLILNLEEADQHLDYNGDPFPDYLELKEATNRARGVRQ